MKKKVNFLILVFILGSSAAAYVMFVAGKEIYRGRKIEKEIESLEAEADRIRSDNESLREKIAYLDTDQFRERIAKEKLNLKKNGEMVVEVRPSTVLGDQIQNQKVEIEQKIENQQKMKIYQKWWKQFFSY